MRLDSRALVADLLLTFWHRLPCFECYQSYTSHHCQPQTENLVTYHSIAAFFWYLVPAGICERHYESSISWAI